MFVHTAQCNFKLQLATCGSHVVLQTTETSLHRSRQSKIHSITVVRPVETTDHMATAIFRNASVQVAKVTDEFSSLSAGRRQSISNSVWSEPDRLE